MEREALYRYLTARDRKLNQKSWNYLGAFPFCATTEARGLRPPRSQ